MSKYQSIDIASTNILESIWNNFSESITDIFHFNIGIPKWAKILVCLYKL